MNLYVFRWTRRNRISTGTIEESEVVGCYRGNLATAVARVFMFFGSAPKMSR